MKTMKRYLLLAFAVGVVRARLIGDTHGEVRPSRMSGDGWIPEMDGSSALHADKEMSSTVGAASYGREGAISEARSLGSSLGLLAKNTEEKVERLISAAPRGFRVILIMAVIIATLLLLFFFGGKMLGEALEKGIETCDRSLLGTEVEIGDIICHPFSGLIEIKHCTVKNPTQDAKGAPIKFESEYVFHASTIKVDLDMWSIIKSFGKIIEVECLEVKKLDAIVEYTGYFSGTSNVQTILDHLEGGTPSEKKKKMLEEAEAAKSNVESSRLLAVEAAEAKKPEDKKAARQVLIHKLKLKDIGAKCQTKLLGARVAVGDMDYQEFSEETKTCAVDDIICVLLKSLAKTLVANMAGKGWADKFL